MKKYLIIILSCITVAAKAQIPEDALKFSWQPTNGTARINAVGGAMGSLGGDISATFINPAGLAFFKNTDIVLSPGYSFLKNKSQYRGTNASDNKSSFNLGASGVVSGWQTSGSWTSKAIGFAVTRTANFNSNVYYTGLNDFSSGAEQYAIEAVSSGTPINNVPGNTNLSFGTRMAGWNFLIDTATIPGRGVEVVSMAMWDALRNNGDFLVDQSQVTQTTGGVTEIALGFAASNHDKFYLGGSIGLPIVNYEKRNIFREQDATGNDDNNFDFYELDETFTTKGMGINAKLGLIFKPVEFWRVGFAVHTPTWYSLEDSYFGSMAANLDNYRTVPITTSTNSDQLNGGIRPIYNYELITPWRLMVSGSYVLREIEDVRKQKGFITADVEYVTYKSNRYRNAEEFDDGGYYDEVNETMKEYYKNAFNFRIGGELKFTTLMTRLGFSYYGNPYSDSELKANRMFISGGLGYRNAGMYIDLTYVHGLQKDANFPYRLSDKANTFATTKGSGSNLMLTLGFKI